MNAARIMTNLGFIADMSINCTYDCPLPAGGVSAVTSVSVALFEQSSNRVVKSQTSFKPIAHLKPER